MGIYLVTADGNERLIDAPNKASARNFVAKDTVAVAVAKQADLFRIAKAGGDVETVTADQATADAAEGMPSAGNADDQELSKTKR